eukprot:gene5225-5757_t
MATTLTPLDWQTFLHVKYRLYYAYSRAWLIDAFEIDQRKSTIEAEIFSGYIHFISCLYILPVIPNQLSAAGYDKTSSINATAIATAFGCLLSSYITNLPFIVAPPTAVSIYLSVALQQIGEQQGEGAVILSGAFLLVVGICRPLLALVSFLIPDCIQASTAVGIGLITALAGAIELDLVVPGKFTIVEMGPITPAIVIAVMSTVLIAWAMHRQSRVAFLSGLFFGTFAWWWVENAWPPAVAAHPSFHWQTEMSLNSGVGWLLLNLIFLDLLVLNGIARTLSDLAHLTGAQEDAIPRGNWLFIVCGLATILSGYLSGPPILLSPETAGGIKAGARTGLSTLVCGLLFLVSLFFAPIFSAVPAAGTSPLLIIVGLVLFMNTSRINWQLPAEAVPAFFVLLLIPFTYSILCGVGFGYVLFISIGLVSGDLWSKSKVVVLRLWQHGVTYQNVLATFRPGKYQRARGSSSTLSEGVEEGSDPGGASGENGMGGDMEMNKIGSVHNEVHAREGAIENDGEISPPTSDPVESSVEEDHGPEQQDRHHPVNLTVTGIRGRNNSLIDRLPMDLTTGFHSMQA